MEPTGPREASAKMPGKACRVEKSRVMRARCGRKGCWWRGRALLLAALLSAALLSAALAVAGCVPLTDVDGAPCPCPADHSCCRTLSRCLADPADCPQRFPPSSNQICERDADCPTGELCNSWQDDTGAVVGFRECRRDCSQLDRCAAGEQCRPSLTDGRPVSDSQQHVVSVCRSLGSHTRCVEFETGFCMQEQLGGQYCEEGDIHACFPDEHMDCGKIMRTAVVERCEQGGCVDDGQGPKCSTTATKPELCSIFPCRECENPPPGIENAVCADDRNIAACLVMPYDGPTDHCDRICLPFRLACADERVCVEQGGAHCE